MASIKVVLGDRKYPLIVEDGKEDETLAHVQKLNAQLNEIKSRYNRDLQDSLAMLLIQNSLDGGTNPTGKSNSSACGESLEKIHKKLQELL